MPIIQNRILVDQLKEWIPNFEQLKGISDTRALLHREVRSKIPENLLTKMTEAFSTSISTVFQLSLISVGIALVFILLMSKAKITDTKN